MGDNFFFNRQQPTHMPLQPPQGLMSDPLSMLMLLYGPQFAEMMVGPGKFIPQLNPSQNIVDQRDASQYQRTTLANTLAAANSGDAEVAKKVSGLMALVTGEKPTELNKNTASSVAGIVNSPIIKGMLGQAVGPENLEGVMFGRRGDPSALAAAVNRMGYFRQDPGGGGERMSAQGLEQFTKGLHSTLYGPGADVDQMRGLMAGQTAQLMDHLFQRGTLPQSIGALAPAERARLVSGQSYNAAAVDRAARDIGHRDMLQQAEYANAGAEEQKRMLEGNLPQYRQIARSGSAPEAATVDTLARSLARQEMSRQGDFSNRTPAEQNRMVEDSLEEYRTRVKRLVEETNDYKKSNNTTLRDDQTVNRLAKEFARRELSKDETFTSASPQEQEQIVEKNLDKYRTRITDTLDQVDKLRDADPRSMSPEQRERMSRVEQTEEYKALSANVDASRVGKTLKDYAGAISSVREIFGDNGSPNAPMPALLAALEQLTAGASHQMNPAKVQGVLREMRLAAKETGIGFEQLVGFSGQMQAMGDTLGIAKPLTVQNTVSAMNAVKAMEDNGAFAGNRFGQLSKQEALNETGARIQRGTASASTKVLAAMSRAVLENPEAYRGTETEALVKAYRDPSSGGNYTINGETRNVYEVAGRYGAGGLGQMFVNNGGNAQLLNQHYYDPGTQEFITPGGELVMQSHDLRRVVEQRVGADVTHALRGNDPTGKITAQVSHELGQALATEGSKLDQAERPRFMQNKATEALRNAVSAQNPGMRPAEIEAEVQRLLPSFGGTFEKRREFFQGLSSGVNQELTQRTGQGLTALGQVYNNAEAGMRQTVRNKNRARQMGFAALGHEDPLSARFGEVLNSLGSGEQMSFSDVAARLLGAVEDSGFNPQNAETISRSLAMNAQTMSKASFDTGELDSLVKRASGGDDDALNSLRRLAVSEPDKALVTDEQLTATLSAGYTDEELDHYYRIAGKDPAGADRQTKIAGIVASDKARDSYFAGRANEQSETSIRNRAAALAPVTEDEVAERLVKKKTPAQIQKAYESALPNGTAAKTADQARELARNTQFVRASGTLAENEMTYEMFREQADRFTNTAAGFTPEEREKNDRAMKHARAINDAIGFGTLEAAKEAVPEILRGALGDLPDATRKDLEGKVMAVIEGSRGTDENKQALESLKDALKDTPGGEAQAEQVLTHTQALRDAKEGRQAATEKKVVEERRDQREQRQEQEDRDRDRERKQRVAAPLDDKAETRATDRPADAGKPQQGQTAEASAADAARRANQAAEQNKPPADGGGGKDGRMQISGNLTIHDMRNAMISAWGEPPQFSPENGATVVG